MTQTTTPWFAWALCEIGTARRLCLVLEQDKVFDFRAAGMTLPVENLEAGLANWAQYAAALQGLAEQARSAYAAGKIAPLGTGAGAGAWRLLAPYAPPRIFAAASNFREHAREMGTKLANARGKDLYAFWGTRISEWLNEALAEQGDDVLLNLASNEYFSAVKRTALNARIINTEFKDLKNGQYKIISFYAKKARGMMSRFVIEERINDPARLKQFDVQGYRFNAEQSKPDNLVFWRDHAPE